MNLQLENKVAIVTASSKGLGLATACQLAAEGSNVIICSSTQHNLEAALAKLSAATDDPDKISGRVLDLSKINQFPAFITSVVEQYGGIDILVTNTAGPQPGSFDTLPEQQLSNAYQNILLPVYTLIQLALPYLRKSRAASILSITSLSVKQPIEGLLLSNVFRPAIAGLVKTLSKELGPEGIRVNSILPGWISTDRTMQLLNQGDQLDKTVALENSIPLKRLGKPEEFANTAAFLVSPAASYLNGVMLQIDGGLYNGLI